MNNDSQKNRKRVLYESISKMMPSKIWGGLTVVFVFWWQGALQDAWLSLIGFYIGIIVGIIYNYFKEIRRLR